VKPHARRGFVHVLDLERRSDGKPTTPGGRPRDPRLRRGMDRRREKAFPGQRVGVYTSADDIAAKHVPANCRVPVVPGVPVRRDVVRPGRGPPAPLPSGMHPLFWQFTSTPLDREPRLSQPRLTARMGGRRHRAREHHDKEDDMPDVKDLWAYKGQLNGKPDPHDAYAYLRGTNADVRTVGARRSTAW
jgi:hypothetical protein